MITNFQVVFLLIVIDSLALVDAHYEPSSGKVNDFILVPGGHKIYYEIHDVHKDERIRNERRKTKFKISACQCFRHG